jgi:hypothetical protein
MWSRRSKNRRATRQVVVEAERLLSGRILELDCFPTRRVPAWTVISILAHRARPDLAELASEGLTRHPGSWGAILGYLAAEMVKMTPDEPALLGLQRQVLVPLELALLADEEEAPATPGQLAILVMGALDRHQIRPDRGELPEG